MLPEEDFVLGPRVGNGLLCIADLGGVLNPIVIPELIGEDQLMRFGDLLYLSKLKKNDVILSRIVYKIVVHHLPVNFFVAHISYGQKVRKKHAFLRAKPSEFVGQFLKGPYICPNYCLVFISIFVFTIIV